MDLRSLFLAALSGGSETSLHGSDAFGESRLTSGSKKSSSPNPIDELPLFSNYSPCFHKIGYIQKIVYQKNNYLVKSMIEKSVYFYKIGRFFPGQGGRSLVESRSDFRPLFAGVGRSLVKV